MRALGVVLLGVFLGLAGVVMFAELTKPVSTNWYKVYFVNDASIVALEATGIRANGTCTEFFDRRGEVVTIVCATHTVTKMASEPPADVPKQELAKPSSLGTKPLATEARG